MAGNGVFQDLVNHVFETLLDMGDEVALYKEGINHLLQCLIYFTARGTINKREGR